MRYAISFLVALSLIATGCLNAVGPGPIIVVTASYPGADAQLVGDTVAAPIEQQINGVENMVRLESESRNDGSYVAYVRFRPYTDPNMAQVLVQNRVALAQPVLPEAVSRAGIAVKVITAAQNEKGVTIVVVDRGSNGWDALQRFSRAALKRISADGAIVKPEAFPGSDVKQVHMQIDAMQTAAPGRKIDEMKAVRVRSANGDSISLGTIAAFELVSGPSAIYRIDMYPAVRITGLPSVGKTAESAAARCAELADAERKSRPHAAGLSVENLTGR